MSTRLAMLALDRVSESSAWYDEAAIDYEHDEHRCAEHE